MVRRPRLPRLFVLCCLFLLVVGTLSVPLRAQTVTELRLEFGKAGLEVRLDGNNVGTTNAEGRLVIRVEVVDGQVLLVEASDGTVEARVERRILEAGVPDTWLLDGELRPKERGTPVDPPSERPTEKPAQPTRPAPPTLPPPAPPSAPPSAQPAAKADPCDDPSSFGCLQHQLEELEATLAAGDCRDGLARLDALLLPEGSAPHAESVLLVAGWYLDCGARLGEVSWLRRAIDLLQGVPRLACQERRAQQLAVAYQTLAASDRGASSSQVFEQAISYFAQARQACGEAARVALEWQLHFLLLADQVDRALDVATAAGPQEPAFQNFLLAWALVTAGPDSVNREQACAGAVDLAGAEAELPCQGVPRDYCRQQVGRALVECATSPDAYRQAAAYLAPLLEQAPSLSLRRLVAESWLQGEDFAAAAEQYRLLLDAMRALGQAPSPIDERRYADAVLFWHEADAEDLLAANEAYGRSAVGGVQTVRQQALLLNNRTVLLLRLARVADEPGKTAPGGDSQFDVTLREAAALLERVVRQLPGAAPTTSGESASEESSSGEDSVDTMPAAEQHAEQRLATVLRLNLARLRLALAQRRQAQDPRTAYQEMKQAESYLQQLQTESLQLAQPADEVWRLGSDFIALVPADAGTSP